MVFQILLLLGVFVGIFYSLDNAESGKTRLLGFAFFTVSVMSYVLMFLRGPLLGIAAASLIFILAALPQRRLRSKALRMGFSLTLIGIAAFFLYSVFVPEALNKFAFDEGGLSSFVGEERIEQANIMLSAFAQNLAFGMGAGVPIPGYARSGGKGLSFELQYLMLLYRFGLVICVILLCPVIWFFGDLFRILRRNPTIALLADGKFMLSALMSLLTVFIAGATNPYLTAVFTPFLAILYLASREFVLQGIAADRALPNHVSVPARKF